MLKANELRIGNWVNYYKSGSIFQNKIYCINYSTCTIGDTVNRDTVKHRNLEPILLTEEWLVKFGFEKHDNIILPTFLINVSKNRYGYKVLSVTTQHGNEYISIRQVMIDKPREEDDIVTLLNGDIHGRPFYVHQLQNLYFALTGEELQINEQTED